MALEPKQQYYRAVLSPLIEQIYGDKVKKCVVAAVSTDIVTPEYAVGDVLLCIDKAWIVLDTTGGDTNGFLVDTSTIVLKITP